MHITIRLAGYGGYGVVTASRILGLAFTRQGYHTLQTESHGAAARGGSCTTDLTISSNPIFELGFDRPDILATLTAPAFLKCCSISPDLSSNFLLIESHLLDKQSIQSTLKALKQESSTQVFRTELGQVAEELGHVRYLGVASLGAITKVDERIDIELLETAVRSDVKLKRFAKENLHALHRGAELVSPY
ncbi:MAG: 2-oxoacid:acceptor oxidoreductase family protein [Promethearchaeota archaeon]